MYLITVYFLENLNPIRGTENLHMLLEASQLGSISHSFVTFSKTNGDIPYITNGRTSARCYLNFSYAVYSPVEFNLMGNGLNLYILMVLLFLASMYGQGSY